MRSACMDMTKRPVVIAAAAQVIDRTRGVRLMALETGQARVEQADVDDGSWEITHIQLNFTGKIMLVKSLVIKSDEILSDFRRVPADLTFPQGVELLKQEWAKMQQQKSDTVTASKNSH